MGYYSTATLEWQNLKFKSSKEELQKKLEYTSFYDFTFETDDNGRVIDLYLTEEYTKKYYDETEVAEIFADDIEKGELEMYFLVEDGERWKFKITKNKVEEFRVETIYKKIKEIDIS